jgi:hypothetical protein
MIRQHSRSTYTSLRAFVCGVMFCTPLLATEAFAQNLVPQVIDPKACAERLPLQQAPQAPAGGNVKRESRAENLSDHLDRTEGVICPPLGVDPEIVEPPPAGGRTPVIPPPGSPGGDPTVRPK